MKLRKKIIVSVFAFLGVLVMGGGSGILADSQPVIDCSTISGVSFTDVEGNPVTITSASILTTAGVEVCDVRGIILPEINFALRMPATTWNERFIMSGSGGTAGSIRVSSMDPNLQQGYSAVVTDTGHVRTPPGESWAMPENELTNQKIIDYGYRANHEVATLAKQIIAEYYGQGPAYSYFTGCSNGGREALIEAQRYPEDFDGILAACGPSMFPGRMMGFIWNYNVVGPDVPKDKLCLQSFYVYEKCDAMDGVKDGLIENPLACEFDPMTELPACDDDVDGPDCWTTAQRIAIKAIYDGPRTSYGEPITLGPYNFTLPGMPLGSEVCRIPDNPSTSMWMSYIAGGAGVYGDVVRYMVLRDLTFDPALFNYDTDPAMVMARSEAEWMNAYNPDLSGMKALGHKLLQWEAWGVYSPAYLYEYYRAVMEQMGGQAETDDFYRAYLVPGSGHCGGGIGPSNIDWFAVLKEWVEDDIAPDTLIGSRADSPYGPAMTRPICPYPQVAKYVGTGDITVADNFYCAQEVEVRVKPETLNLRSKGKFTAFIDVPLGYNTWDWDLKDVTCEGASAVKIAVAGKTRYLLMFNRQDVKNVSAGEAVTLTVRGTIYNFEREALFEGSDTVRVIKRGK